MSLSRFEQQLLRSGSREAPSAARRSAARSAVMQAAGFVAVAGAVTAAAGTASAASSTAASAASSASAGGAGVTTAAATATATTAGSTAPAATLAAVKGLGLTKLALITLIGIGGAGAATLSAKSHLDRPETRAVMPSAHAIAPSTTQPTRATAPAQLAETPPATPPLPAADTIPSAIAPDPALSALAPIAVTDLPAPRPTTPPPQERATTEQPDPLMMEARLLEEARACIARGDLACATTRLRDHDARFANAPLADEASLLAIEVARARADRPEARRLARHLLDRHPTGPYATRAKSILDQLGD